MIIAFIIALAVGLFAGWRVAIKYQDNKNDFILKENIYLRECVEALKGLANNYYEWSLKTEKRHTQTIESHNINMKATLLNILPLLIKQEKETGNENEREKIADVIKTIKAGMNGGISSSNVE
jgi:hypothetical protein